MERGRENEKEERMKSGGENERGERVIRWREREVREGVRWREVERM